MKLQGLYEFVAVAQTQSFTLAAKRLNLSVAQVSRQISALEQHLTVKLFYRSTRKVTLTEEGQIYFDRCVHIVDLVEEAQQALSAAHSEPKGKIKLTAPVTYGEQVILPLVTAFARQHEQVTIDAHLTNRQVNLVEQGFDLAIRIGDLADSNLMAKKLCQRQTYFCASPEYLSQQGEPLSPNQLSSHNCLLGTLAHWRSHYKGSDDKLKVGGNIRYNSGTALLDAAIAGVGIVQLPDFYVLDAIKLGKLTPILVDFQPKPEGIWLVYPYNRQLTSKVRFLIDFLHDALSDT